MDRPRLGIVVLAVGDLPRAVAFYERVLGWPRAVDAPAYVELQGDGVALGLYARDGFGRNTGASASASPSSGTTSTELYLRVEDADRVEKALRDAGARQLSPRAMRDWGESVSYWADLDANVVAVAQLSAGRSR